MEEDVHAVSDGAKHTRAEAAARGGSTGAWALETTVTSGNGSVWRPWWWWWCARQPMTAHAAAVRGGRCGSVKFHWRKKITDRV